MQQGKKCGENRIDLYNARCFLPMKADVKTARRGLEIWDASRRSRRSGGICVASRACWRSFGPPTCREQTRPELKTAPSEALEGNVSTSEQRVASPHAEKTYTALQDTEADLLQLRTLGSDHIYTTSRPRRLCRRASSSGGPQRSCFRPGTKKPPLRSH